MLSVYMKASIVSANRILEYHGNTRYAVTYSSSYWVKCNYD